MNGKQVPFWLITFAILIGLTVPILIQNGMFMDAVLYTSVANNLSEGIGTFWFPVFSETGITQTVTTFHEHPPLVFGIQSLFFKLLGHGMYTERFYTFLTMVITSWLIWRIWRLVYPKGNALNKLGWIALILWITVPACFWCYANNMLENTMGIFTLLSVLCCLLGFKKPKFSWLLWMGAGVFIVLATLSKGLPGFFPIALPLLYYISTKKITFLKAVVATLFLAGVPFIIYLVLLNMTESRESLHIYIYKRLLFRIDHQPTAGNRFYILYELTMQIFLQLILAVVALVMIKGLKIKVEKQTAQLSVFFILLGLSASLPLLLTLVQKGFYFIPALPFFAIGFGSLVAVPINAYLPKLDSGKLPFKIIRLLSVLALVLSITYSISKIGKYTRDQHLIEDVMRMGTVVPYNTTIGTDGKTWSEEWSLQCYLMRYCHINLKPDYYGTYFLMHHTSTENPPEGYTKLEQGNQLYDLYLRKK